MSAESKEWSTQRAHFFSYCVCAQTGKKKKNWRSSSRRSRKKRGGDEKMMMRRRKKKKVTKCASSPGNKAYCYSEFAVFP